MNCLSYWKYLVSQWRHFGMRSILAIKTHMSNTRVAKAFGAAHPHLPCLFAHARCRRIKVLMQEDYGVWLAASRLNLYQFVRGDPSFNRHLPLSEERLSA